VKYVNRIFSGFGCHRCVANRIRIRIRIPTSWARTGVGLKKAWVRTPLKSGFPPYVTLHDETKVQFGCDYFETSLKLRDHWYQCCLFWYFMTSDVMFSDEFLMSVVLATNLMLTGLLFLFSNMSFHFRTKISHCRFMIVKLLSSISHPNVCLVVVSN